MRIDVVKLTQELIAIPSESQGSNRVISDFLQETLQGAGFEVERLSFIDQNGEEKVSLVAKKGEGQGGLGLFSHSDTVPGSVGWQPFDPLLQDGRLFGRGSCDMKGPLAATIAAGAAVDARHLKKPLTIVVTADEEVGYGGAYQVAKESSLAKESWPDYGVICEPTRLKPVYAHKGGYHVYVTAHGLAAHTSTDRGISANFLIAPFMAEMAELAQTFKSDPRFLNHEFDPPTFGFNLRINDGGGPLNVTADKTVCKLSLRAMPNVDHDLALAMIEQRAKAHNLEIRWEGSGPFYTSPDSEIVQWACLATSESKAVTVPFGTEAVVFQPYLPQVVLGPGDIAQAHTVGEWIDVAQLRRAVEVYDKLIERICG